jgi:hypothetical protein
MGGSFSFPSPPPPITIVRPRPDEGGAIDGLSISTAQGCASCKLAIPQGVSSSSATVYREQGDITIAECQKLSDDINRVKRNEMTIDDFKQNARNMMYSYNLNNGYCGQVTFSSTVLDQTDDINEITKQGNARVTAIRRVTDLGGFSSSSKVFIHPSIPFHVKFNGQDVTVSTMTLFHPAPIRVDNIQYDAVLTLGDIGTDSKIIMIPLAGAIRPGESGRFISKIAPYISGTVQPRPGTGIYPRIDVPTGNDWNLSMMFPGSPQNGETVVDSGYFVWYTAPPMEKYLKQTLTNTVSVGGFLFPQTTYIYDWRPVGPVGKQIIMLSKPIDISVFDLQTIKMLPATPTDLPPPLMKTLVYHTPTKCESTPNTSGREGFEVDRCDPLSNIPAPPSKIDSDTIMTWVLALVSSIAIFLGVYYAVKFLPTLFPYVKSGVEKAGGFLAGVGDKMKAVAAPAMLSAKQGISSGLSSAKQGIDARVSSAKKSLEARREDSRRRSRSRDAERELKRQNAIRDFQKAEADAAAAKATDAAIEARRLDAKLKEKPEPATASVPAPEPAPAPEPTGLPKPKPKRIVFEEQPKPKSPTVAPPPAPAPAFDRSKMTAEELRKEARAAGTGLFDPEINARLEAEARENEAAGKEVERLIQEDQAGIVVNNSEREKALKRVEDAKKNMETVKKDAIKKTEELRKMRVDWLKRNHSPRQLHDMLKEIREAKNKPEPKPPSEDLTQEDIAAMKKQIEAEAAEQEAKLNKIKEQTAAQIKVAEQSEEKFKALEIGKRRPQAQVSAPKVPPHQRGMEVKTGTKKKTAEIPEPKPATPPTGPTVAKGPSLQERTEAAKRNMSTYRSPLAFGSRQGRWSTKEERDLADARLRASLSSQDYRKAKGSGRGRKRKNMNNF